MGLVELRQQRYPLGELLRQVRRERGLGIRELCRKIERNAAAGVSVSPSYYCQVENGIGVNSDKISMDFFWAVGVELGVDPLKLFVLSRPNIPLKFADHETRAQKFPIR